MRTREKSFPGVIGRGHDCDNAVTMRFSNAINGSGGDAFGGVRKWPCLRIEVETEVGREVVLEHVALAIEQLLRDQGLIVERRHRS